MCFLVTSLRKCWFSQCFFWVLFIVEATSPKKYVFPTVVDHFFKNIWFSVGFLDFLSTSDEKPCVFWHVPCKMHDSTSKNEGQNHKVPFFNIKWAKLNTPLDEQAGRGQNSAKNIGKPCVFDHMEAEMMIFLRFSCVFTHCGSH